MVRRRQRERSLFEVLLPDGHKLWPDWLRRIDTLLEDESVIEVVAQALEQRWPQSRRRGRPGTPAEVVIRMLILKHLFDWSYDDLEPEVRANLVYRAFTHRCGRSARCENDSEDRGRAGARGHCAVASAGGRRGEAGRGDARSSISHRYDGRRNPRPLSHGQHLAAGWGSGADAHDATGEYRAGRSARSRAESAAERDSPRADNRVSSAVAEDTGCLGRELPAPDGDDTRRAARRGHHDPAPRPASAHGDGGAPPRSSRVPRRSCSTCVRSCSASWRRHARACWAATRMCRIRS